jgi:hypothetical protein
MVCTTEGETINYNVSLHLFSKKRDLNWVEMFSCNKKTDTEQW